MVSDHHNIAALHGAGSFDIENLIVIVELLDSVDDFEFFCNSEE